MHSFITRIVSFVAIAAMLAGYNGVVNTRAKNEEISQLKADQKATVKKNKELLKEASEAYSEAESVSEAGEAPSSADSTGINTAGTGQYKDGTYEGSAQGFGGPIVVNVTISGGRITSVTVTDHKGESTSYYSMAESLTQTIVERQSADVDVVTGATLSSNGIIGAAKEALKRAEA